MVIPSRRGSPWLEPCLGALKSEGVDSVWIVSEEDPALGRWVACGRGDGFARRANRGLDAAFRAGADLALLLNDDTEVAPGTLARLGEAARAGRIVGPVLENPDGSVQSAGFSWGSRSGRLRARRDRPAVDREVDALSGAAMMIRAEEHAALGGFDEGFTWYFEDIDLCLRACDRGIPVRIVAGTKVLHQGGGTVAGSAAGLLARNHLRLSRKRGASAATTLLLDLAWAAREGGLRTVSSLLAGLR